MGDGTGGRYLPEAVAEGLASLRERRKGRWLRHLPERVASHCSRWGLVPTGVAEEGSLSCCVYCTGPSGEPLVLKAPAGRDAGLREMAAVARWGEAGASPRVLAADRRSGVFLMERVLPGTTAWPAGDPREPELFLDLFRRLRSAGPWESGRHLPPHDGLVATRFGWASKRAERDGDDATLAALGPARELADRLLASVREPEPVHGDLQAKNVLAGADGRWYAIDPLACLGDPHSDAALWAVLHGEGPVAARLEGLAAGGGLDPARLRDWARVFAAVERLDGRDGPLREFSTACGDR